MDPSTVTLQMSQEPNQQDISACKVSMKRFAGNATTRNMIDLLLVIIILVLLGIAAPIIRGDFQGKLLLQKTNISIFVIL